ncbi:MAG: hypothetical protein HY291_15690 [Planctomycetes bacterium]|nr:hypothetical protein [Planctomycetota bacterium]
MRMHFLALSLAVAGHFAFMPAAALEGEGASEAKPDRAALEKLLSELSSADFAIRQTAVDSLSKEGEPLRELIRKKYPKGSEDPEVDALVRKLLARLDREALDRERLANRAVFEKDFMPKQKAYREAQSGKWLAIASGKLLPEPKDGANTVFVDLKEADAEAMRLFPAALHRFFIKIGVEGDIELQLGGASVSQSCGVDFLGHFSGYQFNSASGEFSVKKKGEELKKIGFAAATGGFYIRPSLSAPASDRKKSSAFIVSTGFAGSFLMVPNLARELGLERWEIPGKADVKGINQSGPCTRAWVRVEVPGLEESFVEPAAIWEKEAEEPNPEPAVPKK